MHLINYILFFVLVQSTDKLKEIIPPCPDSPNCVNSIYPTDSEHYMKPIDINGDIEDTWKKLLRVLKEDKNVTVNLQEDNLVKAEFKIPVFGYVDDVIFYLDREYKVIHFRSSSRVGYYDFGVNRGRIKKIKNKLNED